MMKAESTTVTRKAQGFKAASTTVPPKAQGIKAPNLPCDRYWPYLILIYFFTNY